MRKCEKNGRDPDNYRERIDTKVRTCLQQAGYEYTDTRIYENLLTRNTK